MQTVQISLDPSPPPGDSIQVFIRIKPESQQSTVIYTHNEVKLDRHHFAFDRVFPGDSDQQDIFNVVGKKLISHTLDGYNSCVFVYGQTGSGKTYTMMGNSNGLMQRSFAELFEKIDHMPEAECLITCSYFELYNEQIIDLLDPKKEKKLLNIRQDVKRGVFVQNITEETVLNAEKLVECLNIGMKNRHVGETLMNHESSRSHSIFTISLSCKMDREGKKVLKTPKLHFVDLAGSERQKMTMASGERLKEAGNINKSLTTLGMVINSLASEKTRTHIPYRDSKLTCLLRDSLGGNSKTFIVATISTSILSFQQTLSTLNFANRAKMVKVKALINEQSLSTNIETYKEQIRKLKVEIAKLRSQKKCTPATKTPFGDQSLEYMRIPTANSIQLQMKFQQLNHKISTISDDIKNNMKSPILQNLMHLLQKSQNPLMQKTCIANQNRSRNDEEVMVNEDVFEKIVVETEQNGEQLLEYMASNHEILKKILQNIDLLKSIKETSAVTSTSISKNNHNIRESSQNSHFKTPSKSEREQYETLLQKRELQIKELYQKIDLLNDQLTRFQLTSTHLQRQTNHNQINQSELLFEEYTPDQLRNLLLQLQQIKKQVHHITQINHQQTRNLENIKHQKKRLETSHEELTFRLKQTKELFVDSQQQLDHEKIMKNKILQNQYKEYEKHIQLLKEQYQQKEEKHESEIQKIKNVMEDMESKEQQYKNQIQILEQSQEFNIKTISEFKQKLQSNKKYIEEIISAKKQLNESYYLQKIELEQSTLMNNERVEHFLSENKELQRKIEYLSKDNLHLSNVYQSIKLQYQNYAIKMHQEIGLLTNHKHKQEEKEIQMQIQYQKDKIQQKGIIQELQSRNYMHLQVLNLQKQQKQLLARQKQQLQSILNSTKIQHQNIVFNLSMQIEQFEKDIQNNQENNEKKDAKIQILQQKIESTKNVVEEFEQLKRTYKNIVKQNYKLKGEYSQNSQNTLTQVSRNQQLISKVAYYEEKFKLMSIQYNKALEVTKRLKSKELALMKKIEFYEEHQKNKKITHHSHADQDEIAQQWRELQLQNNQLKQKNVKLSQMHEYLLKNCQHNCNNTNINQNTPVINSEERQHNQNKLDIQSQKYELQQKEQQIRQKLEFAIKHYNHSNKENTCTSMNVDELFKCWQEIESDNAMKFQAIAKGIKREQKLKYQNNFILKENFYLREKLNSIQKMQLNSEEPICTNELPRKIIKINEKINEEEIQQM